MLTSLSPWSSRWLITGYWSVSHLNSLGMPILSPPAPVPAPLLRTTSLLGRPGCFCASVATKGVPAKEWRNEETPTVRLPPSPMLLPPVLLLAGEAAPLSKKAEAGAGAVEEHSSPTASVRTRPLLLRVLGACRAQLDDPNVVRHA